eukprot:jgi/Mesvir1/23301/Mv20997-RA.1
MQPPGLNAKDERPKGRSTKATPRQATNPIVAPNAVASQPPTDRFDRDFAREERMRKEAKLQSREAKWDNSRAKEYEREATRWEKYDKAVEAEQRQAKQLQSRAVARNNMSSVGYNPITLSYSDSAMGKQLKQEHAMIHYRGTVRAANLEAHSRSQPYNPITGAPATPSVTVPPRPTLDGQK